MRRTPSSQYEDLTRERDGGDALSGRNTRPVQRTIAGDHLQKIQQQGRQDSCPIGSPVLGPLSTHEVGVGDRSLTSSRVIGDLLLPFRGIIFSAQQSTLETQRP